MQHKKGLSECHSFKKIGKTLFNWGISVHFSTNLRHFGTLFHSFFCITKFPFMMDRKSMQFFSAIMHFELMSNKKYFYRISAKLCMLFNIAVTGLNFNFFFGEGGAYWLDLTRNITSPFPLSLNPPVIIIINPLLLRFLKEL